MADATDLTIVMPCLNEAETLAGCIEKARIGIERSGVRGEILVADNGSEDDSVQIAQKLGARVVHVKEKGYGNALRGGIQAASGKWIVMGDADESYDFSETDRFVKKFQEGFELVRRLPSAERRRQNSAGRNAIHTSLVREPALFANGATYVCRAYSRCLLRPPWIHTGTVRSAGPSMRRNGIRHRNDHQSQLTRCAHRRNPHYPLILTGARPTHHICAPFGMAGAPCAFF